MTPELDSAGKPARERHAGEFYDSEFPHVDGPAGIEPSGAAADEGDGKTAATGPSDPQIAAAVRQLASSAERYHDRAQQREGVIDYLRSELELLRRGERRGLLRPLLTQMCRLHADLVRQAESLPPDFDAAKAVRLLQSYAETLGEALEDNGVVTYQPDEGDPFNPRRHRQVKRQPSTDPARPGTSPPCGSPATWTSRRTSPAGASGSHRFHGP